MQSVVCWNLVLCRQPQPCSRLMADALKSPVAGDRVGVWLMVVADVGHARPGR